MLFSFNAFAYCPLHPKTFREALSFAERNFSGIASATCRNSSSSKNEYGEVLVISGDGVVRRGIPPSRCSAEIQVTMEKNARGQYGSVFKTLKYKCD